MRFWNFKAIDEKEVELRIDGEIVDDGDAWIYEWFGEPHASPGDFRDELLQHRGKNLTVWIDSYGGNVFAAAGIYNALKRHDGKVTVKIDGKAMSAATVIAMAGEKIMMSSVGMFMIHNPWTNVAGESADMRKTADVLDEVKESIMNAYATKTGIDRGRIAELMDNETYMSAKTALKEGFIDEIILGDTTEPNTLAFNRRAILNSTNESIRKMIEIQNTPQLEEPGQPEAKNQYENLLSYFEIAERETK